MESNLFYFYNGGLIFLVVVYKIGVGYMFTISNLIFFYRKKKGIIRLNLL